MSCENFKPAPIFSCGICNYCKNNKIECIINKKYYEYEIPDYITNIKIDIGLSFHAPCSNKWLLNEPTLTVFGFEPNPECCNAIIRQDYGNKWIENGYLEKRFIDEKRFHLFNYALSDTKNDEEINSKFFINYNDCGTSSLFMHDQNKLGKIKSIVDVKIIKLKLFFDKFPWDRFEYIDYIKIDAQGSDLNILKGVGDYLKEKVVYVTAEPDGCYYKNADDCNEENINNYMLSQNFERITHPNTTDPTFINNKFKHLKDKIWISQ
jgi:FkbM family methyltransferase